MTSRMKSPIRSLQVGRAVAALMVVAFHLNTYVLPERLYAGENLHPVLDFGYAGVEFFFALSGFIMMYLHQRDLGVPRRFRSYGWKRIVRIYPIYWIVLFALLGAWMLSDQLGPAEDPAPGNILYNALLLPTDGEPLLTIAWTLQHEMLFYGMFGLAILSRPIGLGVLAAWFAACAFSLISAAGHAFPWAFFLSAYNLIFLFGIGAALVYPHLSTWSAWMAFIVGLLGFAATGLADVYGYWPLSHDWRTCAFGVSASLIIAGVAALEISLPLISLIRGERRAPAMAPTD